ncbi:MAG TPA: ABC transporter ATP-binding protein [Streptosporangiaceae bacterium]|jgi:putative ABC transport system ATP-binding protein
MTEPQPVPAVQSGVIVSIAELTKTYPAGGGRVVTAVHAVSLDLAPASVTAITGPSGSGKSSLLRLVGGLERADSGVIAVDTEQITSLPPRALPGYRRRIGLVFEDDLLLPALTVLDNVRILEPGRSRTARDRARELLAAVGLAGLGDERPSRLPPVDRQRVAVARALFSEPGLLLADEPTGALDTAAGGEIVELILRVRDEYGVTVLLATHDPEIAINCDRVVRLLDGRIADDSAAPI